MKNLKLFSLIAAVYFVAMTLASASLAETANKPPLTEKEKQELAEKKESIDRMIGIVLSGIAKWTCLVEGFSVKFDSTAGGANVDKAGGFCDFHFRGDYKYDLNNKSVELVTDRKQEKEKNEDEKKSGTNSNKERFASDVTLKSKGMLMRGRLDKVGIVTRATIVLYAGKTKIQGKDTLVKGPLMLTFQSKLNNSLIEMGLDSIDINLQEIPGKQGLYVFNGACQVHQNFYNFEKGKIEKKLAPKCYIAGSYDMKSGASKFDSDYEIEGDAQPQQEVVP